MFLLGEGPFWGPVFLVRCHFTQDLTTLDPRHIWTSCSPNSPLSDAIFAQEIHWTVLEIWAHHSVGFNRCLDKDSKVQLRWCKMLTDVKRIFTDKGKLVRMKLLIYRMYTNQLVT